MTTKETITIVVTLKNGQYFEHHSSPSKDKLMRLLSDIINELSKRHGGTLTLYHPIGMYRMDDVSSIHIQETEPISEVPPMGFRIDRTIDEQDNE